MTFNYDIIAVGGGPASFFAAITAAHHHPGLNITILEQSKEVLNKVRISGGGRCNVTHACFDPRDLTGFYPRGKRELMGPFHTFMTGDTMGWFEERGVSLKIEDDNRIFPVTDNSMSIVNCLLNEAEKCGITVQKGTVVQDFSLEGEGWKVETKSGVLSCRKLFLGTGSASFIWNKLAELGHTIVPPVPSLFTFNIQHELLDGLAGISFPQVAVKVRESKLQTSGPMLITHWGLSGPVILKLSAEGARHFSEQNYRFEISINLLPMLSPSAVEEALHRMKKQEGKKLITSTPMFDLPKRFWQKLVRRYEGKNWADASLDDVGFIVRSLTDLRFKVNGKSTFKEEFVTCGGVDLKEINFKTYESKVLPNLYMAGEMLDIDAVTGGFNFQACWTGGYIAGQNMGS